jgi:hypothetical protein
MPRAARKIKMAKVTWTQSPKLPIVDSTRSPGVRKLSTAGFYEGIDASFPPAQVLGLVEPKVTIGP